MDAPDTSEHGLSAALERVRRFLDERARPMPFAPEGFLPVDHLASITRTGDTLLVSDLRLLLAAVVPFDQDGDRITAVLADLNVSGWRVESEHGCDGTEEVCMVTCPVPVQVEVSPQEIAAAVLNALGAS